jgi:hypothetical protein
MAFCSSVFTVNYCLLPSIIPACCLLQPAYRQLHFCLLHAPCSLLLPASFLLITVSVPDPDPKDP